MIGRNLFFAFLVLLIVQIVTFGAAESSLRTSPLSGQSINDIVASMTLEEKVGQMVQIDIAYFMIQGTDQVDYEKMQSYIQQYQIGSILNSPFSGGPIDGVTGWTASQWRELIVNMQNFAMNTTSKIPIIYGIDSIHGATFVKNAALFPQALTLAATFNRDLAYTAGQVTSKDTRAAGIPWIFAPVLGLGLQPLWARYPETFGEDPYTAANMGASIIKGLQYLADDGSLPQQTAACMKHFIAYSIPVNGHDRSPVQLPDRLLRQLYIPSFQAAIDAGVLTGMESYQEVGGVPMVSSNDYLTTLLRKEMNFTGFLVTDYQEIENLHNWHLVSETQRDAVALAMQDTTIDMSMVPLDSSFYTYLIDLVNSGEVPVSRVDESVKRILQVKQTLGLLSNPIPAVDDPLVNTVGQQSDWDASLNAAREAITLVKNTGNSLPLANQGTILLTGPTCNSSISQTGGWAIHWQGVYYDYEFSKKASVYDGFSQLFTGILLYAPGPNVTATSLAGVDMTAVTNLANQADQIVICVGEGTYAEKPGDIDDLAMPAGQIEYVQALAAIKPVTLVVISGRPRLIHTAVEASQAVVLAYQPGPLGGQAIAETIFGTNIPSGRLPFTYPRNQADIAYPYHRKNGDQCTVPTGFHTTAYVPCTVEWEFGTGLSYTSFEYSNLIVSQPFIDETQSLQVSVTVTNTGTLTAKHTVMMFIYDMYRRVTPEYKLLKRFDKIELGPQGQQTLSWTISSNDLEYVGVDSRYVLESGTYRIGMSPYVDCRSSNQSDWKINTQDTTSSEIMCQEFNLTLSSNYNAVCEKACELWSSGICGTTISNSECSSACLAQNWQWDYVDCITNYYQEPSCTDYSSIQCYDAYGFNAEDSNNDEDKYSVTFVALITVGVGLVGLILGAIASYYYLKQTMGVDTKGQGFDPLLK